MPIIKLAYRDGNPVYVNSERIIFMYPQYDWAAGQLRTPKDKGPFSHTCILFSDNINRIEVLEAPDLIRNIIREANIVEAVELQQSILNMVNASMQEETKQ